MELENDIIPWAVHISPGIYLTTEENPGEPSREPSDEGCATSYRLKWGPLPPNDVCRIAQHVSEGEGRKKGSRI